MMMMMMMMMLMMMMMMLMMMVMLMIMMMMMMMILMMMMMMMMIMMMLMMVMMLMLMMMMMVFNRCCNGFVTHGLACSISFFPFLNFIFSSLLFQLQQVMVFFSTCDAVDFHALLLRGTEWPKVTD